MTFRMRFSGRSAIAFIHDVIMVGVSFLISLWLRLGDSLTLYVPVHEIAQAVAVFMIIGAVVFQMMGLYRGIWRYASISDLIAITKAVSLVILIFFLARFLWTRLDDLPRSLPLINWFILMALIGGPRFLYRVFKDRRLGSVFEDGLGQRIPLLLVGASDGAELFLRALSRADESPYHPVGILSENPGQVGRRIHGVEVLGTLSDLERVCGSLPVRPTKMVLTKDDMDRGKVRKLFTDAGRLGMSLSRTPKLTDFNAGGGAAPPIREIAVEDLLGRPQKPLDRDAMRALIEGRRVLVTGAGGSIGAELTRQAAEFAPGELIMLESSEYALYSIDLEIGRSTPDIKRCALIADVRDPGRIDTVIAQIQPDIIFHAAALKHVPLVEANMAEGLLTNVIGTANVAEAAARHGVSTMVMISTDKAVNPTNIMGASKRIAERYVQALDLTGTVKTRFVTVRFGNVLDSTGSVVPLFRKQLAAGGPLTVTHPDMTRYFMTIREAVELVLQAAAFDATTGRANDGKIYVLDMGEPVKIIDLARQMIRLAGFVPDKDIKIEIVGARPGEKLFEEIFHGTEKLVPTESPGILLAAPRAGEIDVMRGAVTELREICRRGDAEALIAFVQTFVPEYQRS